MDWEAEYNAGGPSFIDRARSALPDDDNDLDMPPPAARHIIPAFREDLSDETPLEQLTRHWMNERHAPDILPAQEALLSTLLDHIRRQVRDLQIYSRIALMVSFVVR